MANALRLRRRTVAEIQRKVNKQRKRRPFARFVRAKDDKDTIAAWRMDLNRILHVFNVRSTFLYVYRRC